MQQASNNDPFFSHNGHLTVLEQIARQESLRQWYQKYINCFREEYEKLSADEKKGMNNTNNFLDPCQIEVFWITDPDYQLIIQSNFSDRPDKEIIVNGPYKAYEFRSQVIPILRAKRWMRKIKHNLPRRYNQFDTLGEVMALKMREFVKISKNHSFMSEKRDSQALMNVAVENTWTMIFTGNIEDLDHAQEVGKTIQRIKEDAKSKQKRRTKPQQPAQPPNPDYMGFGAHMFPPIMIGSEPKHSIEELICNTSNRRMRSKVLDMKNGNSQIIVNEDGFIFVETRNKKNALKILNLIMAHGAFYGFPLHPVLEHELVLANYDKQNLTMGNMEWSAETRRSYLMDNCFNPTYDSTTLKKSVKLDTIKEILSNTEKLLEHEDLAADLRLLNDGWAHLLNSDFAPSFILGWSVIEMHYHDLWHALPPRGNAGNSRSSKQNNSSRQSIHNILRDLKRQDKIDKDSFGFLMELKEKRNTYYHERKQVTEDDAKHCIKYATDLIVSKIHPYICLSENLMLSNTS